MVFLFNHRSGEVTYASCIMVQGHIVKSLGRGQAVELIADTIRVSGKCDAEVFYIIMILLL